MSGGKLAQREIDDGGGQEAQAFRHRLKPRTHYERCVATGADAPSGGAVAPVNVQTETGPISIRDAAASLASARERGNRSSPRKPEQPRVNGKFASAQTESTPSGEDAGPETVPGETTAGDPAETPSIEPPRSWSKEDKELFNTLPPETQQRVAERERARESDFLKRQN
jgi:hypothetical protein